MSIPYIWAFTEEALENRGLLNDPTASGSVTYVDGKIGKAIDCANTATINFEDSEALNNDHHTIAFWMNMTASTAGYEEIVLASVDNSAVNRSPLLSQYGQKFHFRYTDTGTGSGVNSGPSDFGETSSTDFSLNTWYHVCITKNAGTIKVYIDGSEIISSTGHPHPSMAGQKIRLFNGNANLYVNDLRIYPSVLNNTEIEDLSRGIVAHYKLNGAGQDGSGYDQHGTASGVTWSVNNRNNDAVINDQYGSFSQSNDSVITMVDGNIARIKALVNQENISFSFWFRSSGFVNEGSTANILFGLNNVISDFSFGAGIGSTNLLYCYIQGQSAYVSPAITLNDWHHVVVVRNGTNMKAYLNNSLEIDSTETITTDKTPIASTFTIGRDSITARNVNADISDLRLYASSLTADDVNGLFTNRARLSSDGTLKAHSIRIAPSHRGADYAQYFINADGTYTVVSFEDNTEIFKNGVSEGTITNAYNTDTVVCVLGDVITADKPFAIDAPSQHVCAAGSWQGYRFATRVPRNNPATLSMFTFHEPADYEIFIDGSSNSTGTIAANSYAQVAITNISNVYVETTQPVSMAIGTDDSVDHHEVFPMREDLLCIPSGTAHIQAGPNATNISIYESDGTKTTAAISAYANATHSGTAGYAAPSVRIISDQPIGAYAYNDGDGSEAAPAAPLSAAAHKFVLPVDATSVAFVGLTTGATVKIYNENGSLIGTETVTGGGTHADGTKLPTHLLIPEDVTYLFTTGWYFICSSPMVCYYEDNEGDENILHGAKYSDYTTYSPFELPSKGGVIGVEDVNEVGVDIDGLRFWTPLDIGPREIAGHVNDYTVTYSGNGEPPRMTNMHNGGSYRFDNSSGLTADYYINYAALPYTELAASGELSVSAWVKFDNVSIAERATIFSWRDAFFLAQNTDGKITCQSYDDNSSTWKGVTSSGAINTDDWWHLLATYDGTNYKLYLNGVENNSSAHSITFGTGSDQNIRIGDNTWGSEGFDGRISQCMIFTRTLTAKEINNLYKLQSNSSAMQRAFDGSLIVSGISDANNG